jgi:methanogenic corrinoid protein MtbC1
LTTTMTGMKDVVKALGEAGVRDRCQIMIGGAPVTQQFANSIGADGYGANASAAVALARSIVSSG